MSDEALTDGTDVADGANAVDDTNAMDDANESCCAANAGSAACDGLGRCPLKKISKNDAVAGIITLAIMGVTIALSMYAQYALTKCAVRSALKGTRLR